MKELIKKIKSQIQLSIEAEEYLISISKEKVIPKGTILIRQGQIVDKVFFVADGCLRSYSIDTNGKEHTLQFSIKDSWISDFVAIHTDEYAALTVECLTESNIIEFNTEKLDGIFTLFPEYEPYQRGVLEGHIINLQRRILNQLKLTAAERYDFFIKQFPDIEMYTRNYHIASYLGITQESLSRIRAKKEKK